MWSARGVEMGKEETTALTDDERRLVERVANERGVSFEEAAIALASEGLAKRVRKRTGRRPSASVMAFRKGKGS